MYTPTCNLDGFEGNAGLIPRFHVAVHTALPVLT